MKPRLVRGFCISVTYLLRRAGRSMQRLAFANNCLPRRNYARQQHQLLITAWVMYPTKQAVTVRL